MNTKIYKCTRKVNNGFVGFIKVFEGKKFLWSKNSGIVRLNRKDAHWDAVNLYLDHCIQNNNSITI